MKTKSAASGETAGFRHLLVPTDGTPFSLPAIRAAVRLAAALDARITGLHVIAPYAAGAGAMSALPGFARGVRQASRQALAALRAQARARGVKIDAASAVGAEPAQAILQAAHQHKCDLIVMASHGRGSLAGLLLGSETNKVLALSSIPVMVCR